MLAFLSSAILGQYDPFTGEHGTLLAGRPEHRLPSNAPFGWTPATFGCGYACTR